MYKKSKRRPVFTNRVAGQARRGEEVSVIGRRGAYVLGGGGGGGGKEAKNGKCINAHACRGASYLFASLWLLLSVFFFFFLPLSGCCWINDAQCSEFRQGKSRCPIRGRRMSGISRPPSPRRHLHH